jgi:hypothetical protein
MPVGSYRVVSLLLPTLRGGKGKGKDRNSLKPKGAGEVLLKDTTFSCSVGVVFMILVPLFFQSRIRE